MQHPSLKIRVAGTQAQVEMLTEQLRNLSKSWGARKIFRVKRYDRTSGSLTGSAWKYHRTFGARRFVNYITLKLPETMKLPESRHPVCMMEGHSGNDYCGRCGAKMAEDPQQIQEENHIA